MNRIILNETSYFGAGCRSVIAVEAARRGFKKAFFVTDKDLIKFGVAAEIIKVFDENQIPYELYSDVKANPTIANVQNGVAAYKASGADFIVALGGGSSIDTAKGIGIVVNNPDFADVKSLEGVADTKHKAVPTFALPTTAGTAAEGTINYDVRFDAIAPASEGSAEQKDVIRLIINVEAQTAFNPGYPLTKRAIYYCSRMISA